MGVAEKTIRDFAGLNLRDSADAVQDNEFAQLQNVYQPTKGVFSPVFGSVVDQASFELASRVSGIWRHYGVNKENFSLYHCVPDTSSLPDNTVDMTLTEVADGTGTLFASDHSGTIAPMYFCYSWIGRGMEQTYNTKNRASFVNSSVAASSQTGHQHITVGAASSRIRVTVPAFPTGITGANIFMARGTTGSIQTDMTYVGTVTTSGGNILVGTFIGPTGARNDSIVSGLTANPSGVYDSNGTLSPGSYWVSYAPVVDPNVNENAQNYNGTVPLSSGLAAIDPTLGFSLSPLALYHSGDTGSLTANTQYDAVVALVDPVSGVPVYVSTVQTATTANTGNDKLALGFSFPVAPAPGLNVVYYLGTHNGTLYETVATTQSIVSGSVIKQIQILGLLNNSGNTAPGAVYPITVISDLYAQQVTLTGSQNAISPSFLASNTSNGAYDLYVFIGTQNPSLQPMTCVGIARYNAGAGDSPNILSIPHHNAQSCPSMIAADATAPQFWNQVNDANVGGTNYLIGSKVLARFGFLMASKNGAAVYEVFPSRSLFQQVQTKIGLSVFSGDSVSSGTNDLHNFAPSPRTQNDKYQFVAVAGGYSQPFNYQTKVYDPQFCFHLGVSYFANGIDIPWMSEGYTLGQLSCVQGVAQTLLPPIPRFVFEYQQALIMTGAQCGNQMFASNANAPQNWATGGYGTLMRFVTIGDATGSGMTAAGVFTPATEATNNPGSFMIAFKKIGTWMTNSVGDPTVSSILGALSGQVPTSMTQVSGRVGCTAYRSVVQTVLGTCFVGQDGNVYLINRVAEPTKIGTKIQNGLAHLVGNDSWMQMITASYHDNHYKISYPSPAAVLLDNVVNDSELWADFRTEGGQPIKWYGPHIGKAIGAQVVLAGDNDDLSRLCADASAVRTFTTDDINSYTHFGAKLASVILSKIYRLGGESHSVRTQGCNLDLYLDFSFNNNVLLEGMADEYYQQRNRQLSAGAAVWNSSLFDFSFFGDQIWKSYSFLWDASNLNGRSFQFKFTKTDAAPFVLAAVTILASPEKRRIIN